MNKLDKLESESIYIIREAYYHVKPLAMLWSMGKDSNVLLWLVRKAFFGKVPFTIILLDTDDELPEVYEFRDKYVKQWNLDYINYSCPKLADINSKNELPPNAKMASRKTIALKQIVKKYKYSGILLGIRRDEQAIRSKERVFSPRDQNGNWLTLSQPLEFWDQYHTKISIGEHLRIHPLLAWTELDIWQYIKQENIPVVPLYFSQNGQRYRSLGEKTITKPIKSDATNIDEIIAELENTVESERAGRIMDNETEDAFEQLRTQGYM